MCAFILLPAASLCLLDRLPDSYKPRFSRFAPEISARAARLSSARLSVSDLITTYDSQKAELNRLSRVPRAFPESINELNATIQSRLGVAALNETFKAVGKRFFDTKPLTNISLISAVTPDFRDRPPIYARLWTLVNPKERLREIPPPDADAQFWRFPGSSGTFVFQAPHITRVSKVVVPDPVNETDCGIQSYRIEFIAKGYTTFDRDYAQFGEILLDHVVWFRQMRLFVNGSIHNGTVCVPRLRLFDDPTPMLQ
jgi:hypothetical protein